jgi:carboxynorspermidine decarboxylase
LNILKPYVDGFSVSSLFEARLAKTILGDNSSIHLTTPGIRPDEIDELSRICTHISCNSWHQYHQFRSTKIELSALGLRINPKISMLDDERYDPCRANSKLGVDIADVFTADEAGFLRGIHFHTVFGSTDGNQLCRIIDKIKHYAGDNMHDLDWINLGGGYFYDQLQDEKLLVDLVKTLITDYQVDVYIEPGKAIVGMSGSLVATVIDCFQSDGKILAVLDTSINHQPEVFEYQRKVDIVEEVLDGHYSAILAGSTCLAGDLFGEYRFAKPVQIGDKVTFVNVGAYSLVKANRFNGHDFPAIYFYRNGRYDCVKSYGYDHYRQQWLTDGE